MMVCSITKGRSVVTFSCSLAKLDVDSFLTPQQQFDIFAHAREEGGMSKKNPRWLLLVSMGSLNASKRECANLADWANFGCLGFLFIKDEPMIEI